MTSVYIGVDNGTSGSVGIIRQSGIYFFPTPSDLQQDYTKTKKNISRINAGALKKAISNVIQEGDIGKALIERPFTAPVKVIIDNTGKKIPTVNMMFYKTSLNAMRSFEATLIVMESLRIGYEIVDSKAWQKEMLSTGIKGSKELKAASKLKGIQMFPQFESVIKKQGDADGLLIAEYCRRFYQEK